MTMNRYYPNHKVRAKISRQRNKIKRNEYDRTYRKQHKQELKEYGRNYFKKHPDKFLSSGIKHHAKFGLVFNLSSHAYKWALQAWSNVVQKRDGNKCQICDKPAEHSHHIIFKSFYPKLSLNTNNGIALCEPHHNEIHRWRIIS